MCEKYIHETFDEQTIKQKIKIENFRDYLRLINKSIDEGNYNQSLLDEVCDMIDGYYKKNNIDNDSVSDGDSLKFLESDTEEEKEKVEKTNEEKAEEPKEEKVEEINEEKVEESKEVEETRKESGKKEKKKKDVSYIPFITNEHDIESKLFNPYKDDYTIYNHINRFTNFYQRF